MRNAKSGNDKRHNANVAMANYIPSFLSGPIANFSSYLALHCGFDFGVVNGDTFGQLLVTNVGSLNYSSAAAPLCPLLHSMGALCMGSTEKRPIVDKETGEIKIANMCTMIMTGDSRYGDAACMNPYF